jgi:hypothetical protein
VVSSYFIIRFCMSPTDTIFDGACQEYLKMFLGVDIMTQPKLSIHNFHQNIIRPIVAVLIFSFQYCFSMTDYNRRSNGASNPDRASSVKVPAGLPLHYPGPESHCYRSQH